MKLPDIAARLAADERAALELVRAVEIRDGYPGPVADDFRLEVTTDNDDWPALYIGHSRLLAEVHAKRQILERLKAIAAGPEVLPPRIVKLLEGIAAALALPYMSAHH